MALLYGYYTSFIVLLGAEINQVVEGEAPEGRRQRLRRLLGRKRS